ncbi:MAG: DUF397 domain-containing protein [Pseudonocardiaceae bacterium]
MEGSGATWRKSTRSNGSGGNCVEVADLDGGYHAVRDSKNPTGPTLIVTSSGWNAFNVGIRNSKFDCG